MVDSATMRLHLRRFAAFAAALLGLAGADVFPAGGGAAAQPAFVAEPAPSSGGEASPNAPGGLSDAGAPARAELRAAATGGAGQSSSGAPAAREPDSAATGFSGARRAPGAPRAHAGRKAFLAHPAQAP